MNKILIKAWVGLTFLVGVLGLLLFIPARTVNYWQAWVYLAVFFLSVFAITYYLMKKDLGLLSRRVNGGAVAEKETSQKIIQSVAQVAFIAIYIVSALDHRFGWSVVPLYVVILGDLVVITGFLIVFLVFKENTFTSAVIAVEKKQKVITSGPYALVRHPMYSGALVMLLGTPLALGSWWALLAVIPMVLVIVMRLLDEERYLLKNLPGYTKYNQKVHWRLVPGLY